MVYFFTYFLPKIDYQCTNVAKERLMYKLPNPSYSPQLALFGLALSVVGTLCAIALATAWVMLFV
ncbi:hypothetical protein AGMMS49944_24830 [Spirochaetia bacterium]|nr:hypothetical protein AGMMS49944_24830 [Spirochaetia bacterium]